MMQPGRRALIWYRTKVLWRPLRNTETPTFAVLMGLSVALGATLPIRWFLVVLAYAVACFVTYAALRVARRPDGYADRLWRDAVAATHMNRFTAGFVVAGVHIAHATLAGFSVLLDLSIVLSHVEPTINSWPRALATCLSAVQIDVGATTDPTSFPARLCTGASSLVGLGLFAMVLSAWTRVFDRVFKFENR